jgi:hypothetical protein
MPVLIELKIVLAFLVLEKQRSQDGAFDTVGYIYGIYGSVLVSTTL